MKGCVILILPQTGLKVDLFIQEATTIYNPNPEYVTSTYRIQAEYEPSPDGNHSQTITNKSKTRCIQLL